MNKLILCGISFLFLISICSFARAGFYDDRDFDGNDLANFIAAYGSLAGSPNYNPDCDFIGDGDVDNIDLGGFASLYGKTNVYLPETIEEVGIEGGLVETPDSKAQLVIPEGAFDEVCIISVASTGVSSEIGEVYQIESSVKSLSEPIEVRLSYNPELLPNGAEEAYLEIVTWNEDGYLEKLKNITIDSVNHLIYGQTTHFSDFTPSYPNSTNVYFNDIPVSTTYRMPIGDNGSEDFGMDIDKLSVSYYPIDPQYPKIRFNSDGPSNNRWYVGTAHNWNKYLTNQVTGAVANYGGYHVGVDWNRTDGNDGGNPIHAIADGVVLFNQHQWSNSSAKPDKTIGFGNIIILGHRIADTKDVIVSVYAHMAEQSNLAVGTHVNMGDILGHIGTTGDSSGNHLHFEIDRSSLITINENGEILITRTILTDKNTNKVIKETGWHFPSNDNDEDKDKRLANYYEPTSFIRNIMGGDTDPNTGNTEWGFNIPHMTEGWYRHNIEDLQVTGGNLMLNPQQSDPYIHSSPLKIPADQYQVIKIRMSSNAPDKDAAIFYITDSEPTYSADKRIAFTLENDSDMHEYTITACEAENPLKWTGNIIGLRIDPTESGIDGSDADKITIDEISVIKNTCGINPSYPDTVIDTISVGGAPWDMAVTPDGSHVYVCNSNDGTVSVIQTSNNTVIDTISVGDTPWGVAVTPDGSHVYVSNSNDGTVSVIQTSNNTVIDTISVGAIPSGVAVTPDGSHVYVANTYGDTVSVIQTSNNTVIDTISVGNMPLCVAVTPDGNYAYLTHYYSDTVSIVSVIQTSNNTVIDTISVGDEPGGVAVTPDGSHVYVANNFGDTVSVIQTSNNTVIDTISVGNAPFGVAVTPNGSYVYVSILGLRRVSVIQTSNNTVIDTISVGRGNQFLAMTPNGSYVYVSNYLDDTVSVIGF